MEKHTLSVTLPLELIREILLRSPVRSVLRFKCVCKSWLSLISDPQFSISHFDLAASPTHRLILRSNYYDNFNYIESIDIGSLIKTCRQHIVYFPSPPRDHHDDGEYYDVHNQPQILGSCRGLVLLHYWGSSEELILWNPSLGVHKRFPKTYFPYGIHDEYVYGFGFDASTDDYGLILIEFPEFSFGETAVFLFSFKTGSWKRDIPVSASYNDLDDIFSVGDEFKAGSLLNGVLHWLVFSKERKVPVIIAFDLIQRSFSEIPLFNHLTTENYHVCRLRVVGGCLCLMVRGCEAAEIWVMKEYKMQSSWTKSTVIPTFDFYPICAAEDGGIFGSNCEGLVKHDDNGELFDYHISAEGQRLYCANPAMYQESLLSLPCANRNETREDDQH
ncbi:hypothetical protein JHK87_022315 [Glycine soja]|nr:hypothetical protein JHK87_022315 [Glycine soja]